MRQRRKKYTPEFKREVLAMVEEGQRSVAQIERDLGITLGLIYKWQARYQIKDEQLQPRAKRAEATRIRQLERGLGIVKQERDSLKKSQPALLTGSTTMKSKFIEQERATFPVRRLCEVWMVAPSGYYAWRKRQPGQQAQAKAELSQQIQYFHQRSRGT